ncbi:MAG: leucine-rich repeat domain-containing protein [Clostridia bacterium]|nr:leucine-rich repeat domain-containing protein [Clostridia bacterium]
MRNTSNLIRSKSQYNRHYHNMRGVDFTGDGSNIDGDRFAYLENMYRDYDGEGEGITESVPGFRILHSFGAPVRGIAAQNTPKGCFILAHAGKNLYRIPLSERDAIPGELAPIGTLAEGESTSFCHGSSIYFLDGKNMHRVDADGNFLTIEGYKQKEVYIPTTYFNAEPLEQRNLLSTGYKEVYTLEDPTRHAYTSEGLYFEIDSAADLTCRLSGRGECADKEVFVPESAMIGDVSYTVCEVAKDAFKDDTELTHISLPRGVCRIEAGAFANCVSLKSAALPRELTVIGEEAFLNAASMKALYIHTALETICANALSGCRSLQTIYIDGVEAGLSDAVRAAIPEGITLTFRTPYRELRLRLSLHEPTETIAQLTVGGTVLPYTEVREGAYIKAIDVTLPDRQAYTGKSVVISAEMPADIGSGSDTGSDFLNENKELRISGVDAILHCTVCEVFDGRVFLSGNPALPNTVFYSARDNTGQNNPTYFGSLNYFNDGIAGFGVKSLLAAGDSLAVFKSGDDGGGSIYYHRPESTNASLLPKIYPVSYVHSGIPATAGSLSFYDDPIFVCEEGICALDKKDLSLERSVICRSHTVNTRLLSEDLSRVRLAKWRGYLAVLAGAHIYLADSHQTYPQSTGSYAYEWYYLNGIGTYKNDRTVYRYASQPKKGFLLKEGHFDEWVGEKTVYGAGLGENAAYYVLEGESAYLAYRTEERIDGEFSPAISLLGLDEYLFFGTENGDLCLFNNDKRGVAPPMLSESDDFDAEEYAKKNGRRIHSDYYDFAGHAPRYALATKRDCCGIPHLTKDTVKGSLTFKCRGYAASSLLLEVGTDRTGYSEGAKIPGSTFGFDTLDFTAMTLDNSPYFTLAFREKEKNWIEKQVAMHATDFRGPFGVYSISYRYTVHGGVKNR